MVTDKQGKIFDDRRKSKDRRVEDKKVIEEKRKCQRRQK